MSLPFRLVTAGLRGGAKRVAGKAELAAWLLQPEVMGAPGRGRPARGLQLYRSFPRGAVGGCWIVLALPGPSRLLGCVSAGDSWRWCDGGSPESMGLGSGPLLPSREWPSSPSVCRRCTLWGCDPAVCQCLGGGGGGLQDKL
jgi:hypothetical protein